MVLVEALAAGRPVVAPAAAGPLEIVTDGAGRLYPPGDAAAAAAALRERARRPRRARTPRAARRGSAFDVRDSASARLDAAVDAAIARDVTRVSYAAVVVAAPLARASSRGCCSHARARRELVVVDTGPDDGGAQLARDTAPRSSNAATTPASARPTTSALEHVTSRSPSC